MRFLCLFCAGALLAACGSNETNPPESTPTDRVVRDGPVGAQPDVISGSAARPDGSGTWERVEVHGVSVEIPTGKDWRVQIHTDPCSSQLEKFILAENQETLDRIKIDLTRKTLDATIVGDEARLDSVISRIQSSFDGSRVLPEVVAKLIPLPTSPACDPKAIDVPTLTPDFEAPAVQPSAEAAEPTSTPVTPPAPPPPPVQ